MKQHYPSELTEVIEGVCAECNDNRLSEVQRFFSGKNVMITGATGFLGKVLMEKLLRSCPGVENLYLLVRQKRGKDIYTRIEEIFDDPVFSRLKEDFPKFRHKVVVVSGDCETTGLGLSLSDRQMLTEKVNIIFHSAATVKFDEHLRAALATNVRAPLHLLRLARDMKDLNRGVRQGDVISPKLFTAALEDAFKILNREGQGININGEYFNHFRFADDIVVMAERPWRTSVLCSRPQQFSTELA
ncbi:hypothetical protein MSG28_015430 [Choristoneura fumiferana]|uniref:Uncharacterized protein n=1 Tax=Choristoneura fumiferana TaxID=7141 RepID=A0ACC0KAQ7_CHOFU|nr:hypothetical protein MSG28_015430 [Choristoneura fumiferana]